MTCDSRFLEANLAAEISNFVFESTVFFAFLVIKLPNCSASTKIKYMVIKDKIYINATRNVIIFYA